MSDQEALTPRVIIVRHGETEWAKSGRFTGTTDIPLTSDGEAQVSATKAKLVGPGNVLDPSRLAQIFVSPRKRAVTTLKLLLPDFDITSHKITYTEDIAEWDYGDYEGHTDRETKLLRKGRGLDRAESWSVWTDGCEGGESPKQIAKRLDKLILAIKKIQKPYMHGEKAVDVLLVAHGLILRCFLKRWICRPIDDPLNMTFEPGAMAVLRYALMLRSNEWRH